MTAPRLFGAHDGREVELHRLESPRGVAVEVLTYGATVHRALVPAPGGPPVNVALGFATLDGYVRHPAHYFGATVGRYANRIREGRFELEGAEHRVATNDGGHSLHGGSRGFDRHVWDVVAAGPTVVTMRRTSPDGEMGFPGNLEVEVRYTLEDTALRVDFHAVTDATTVVNLTNHTCWNLAGEGAATADDHTLQVHASAYVPVGAGLIPTGGLEPVDGTPFDLREPQQLGPLLRRPTPQLLLARGLDHSYVLDRAGDGLLAAARLAHPPSGRVLDVLTTEPGLQVYTGNFLDGTMVGTSGRAYRQGDCVALEPQHLPDSPNRPHFPSTVLRPGEVYASTSVFSFGF